MGLAKEAKIYNNVGEDVKEEARRGAHFTYGNLRGANLRNAILIGTRFDATNLDRINFEGAYFKQVIFNNIDLSTAKGLTCEQIAEAYLCKTKLPLNVQNCKSLELSDCN